MTSLFTYWHTLRHLKPVQFYGKVWHRLYKPAPDLAPSPPLRACDATWVEPARRQPSLIKPLEFCFLNETKSLLETGWDSPDIEKLWRYNLHYFDDLNALDSKVRLDWHLDLMRRWVSENPPGEGTGWEPYPTSLRIVNWIKWALAGNDLSPRCLHSLAIQSRWLMRRLEVHLLGNHLFSNAKALIFAGLFFSGSDADLWLKKGLDILERELPEQILSDGGHFERSTMYHVIALEDMLDLVNLSHAFNNLIHVDIIDNWLSYIGLIRRWLAAMCHPDGEISFFNDAAFGITPTPEEINRYACNLGLPNLPEFTEGIIHLKESGYLRVQRGDAVILLDTALIGPDYLPGHAHADTLAFELSLFGRRIFVNSGTSCYGVGVERMRQRGTAAHNTLVIDGADSSEVWSGFRVARRAYPSQPAIEQHGTETSITCSHDGYHRLPGQPRHTRKWSVSGQQLRIQDSISGSFKEATANFLLHPDVIISDIEEDDDVKVITLKSQKLRIYFKAKSVQVEDGTWHPEFGKTQKTRRLVISSHESEIEATINWDYMQ